MTGTILTGIRTNTMPTLGNYIGAIKPTIKASNKLKGNQALNMMIPDIHSITTPVDYNALFKQSLDTLRIWVAAGLEIEKSKNNESNASAGLLIYPVMMAADILLYQAKDIPVGEDQSQHIEFARDLAIRVNHKFNQEIFSVPKTPKEQFDTFTNGVALRIKNLQDPSRKMSKSDTEAKGVIFLQDDPKIAYKKIMAATTDSVGQINYDPKNQPGICNLLDILAVMQNKDIKEIIKEHTGKTSYGDFKKTVATEVMNFLTDLQNKMATISDQAILEQLEKNEKILQERANQTLHAMQKAVGFRK